MIITNHLSIMPGLENLLNCVSKRNLTELVSIAISPIGIDQLKPLNMIINEV